MYLEQSSPSPLKVHLLMFRTTFSPGQHMARASIWITAGSILTMFNIGKAVDQNGEVIEPSGAYSSGLSR